MELEERGQTEVGRSSKSNSIVDYGQMMNKGIDPQDIRRSVSRKVFQEPPDFSSSP